MNTFFVHEPTSAQQEQASILARTLHRDLVPNGDFASFWRTIPPQTASNHLDAILAGRGADRARIVFSSGGSTGDPKYTLVGFSEMLDNCVRHGFGYRECGIVSEDIVATWGMPSPMNSDFTIYLALAQCNCAILPLGEGTNPDRLLSLLLTFKPTVLLIMPSNFAPLANLLEANDLRLENVRLMLTGGEPLREPDRVRFANLLGNDVRFRSVFQSSDAGTIGYQCEHCDTNDYHLHSELQLAEIADVDSDQIGELVLTNLNRSLMPVVRRRTGDLVRVIPQQCRCGSPSPKLRFVRRVGNDVKLGGEKFDTTSLAKVRETLELPMDDFRVELDKIEQAVDVFRIYSDILDDDPALQLKALDLLYSANEKLRSQISCNIVARPLFLPMNGAPTVTAGGKIRDFIDLRG